jgi:hypothetical protein
LRRAALAALVREGRITVAELADRCCADYNDARAALHALVAMSLARVSGHTQRAGASPPAKIYAPTELSARALGAMNETGWVARGTMTASGRASGVRRRGKSASGVIAGPITIGRGFRWGAREGPW